MTSQCQNGIFQPNDKNDKSEATEQEKTLLQKEILQKWTYYKIKLKSRDRYDVEKT